SSGAEWVARLRPRVVLISCGEGNRFGHPDSTVLDRYRRAGAAVWRTDQEGAIRVTLRDRGAWVSTRRHPAPVFVPWSREPP
ncbi:MAG: ComEC/Rec2 family competence protein, partial [Candidatus Eiseniibacteriota bacterium]